LSLDDGARDALDGKIAPTPPGITFIPSDLRDAHSPKVPSTDGIASPRPVLPASNSTDSIGNLQQTVSLLIAERADLQSQIACLQASLASAKGDSQLLAEGRVLISQLEGEKRDLLSRADELDERARKAEEESGELGNLRKEVEGLRKDRDGLIKERGLDEERRKEREQGEKERLKELERAREREGGLEAEVGRLRQVCG